MNRPNQARLPELYMKLLDRHKLAKLMVIQGVSNRKLAAAAGWKSHSYVARLLSGEATTVKAEPAARIARHFGVGVDDLFLPRLASDSTQNGKRQAAA